MPGLRKLNGQPMRLAAHSTVDFLEANWLGVLGSTPLGYVVPVIT